MKINTSTLMFIYVRPEMILYAAKLYAYRTLGSSAVDCTGSSQHIPGQSDA